MVEQGTEEWFAVRLGKVTASNIHAVMAKGKATRANYMAKLIAERLTGQREDSYQSPAMAWGTEHEANAAAAYELHTGRQCDLVGFVDHPEIDGTGASPDRLVGAGGLVEIKCPNTATHIATLTGGGIKRQYALQMQWQMACTGRGWCDFVSYDPRMPIDLMLHVQRVESDDEHISEIEDAVSKFIAEMEGKIVELRKAAAHG